MPIIGYDFKENKNEFYANIYAQAFDLLNNTYELYYINKLNRSESYRSRKILSRCYEAVSYISLLDKSYEISELREKLFKKINGTYTLEDSERYFYEAVRAYNKRKRTESL